MRLKKVCERFIAETSSTLTAPLKALLARVQVILQLAAKDQLDPNTLLHQQPFAAAGETLDLSPSNQECLSLVQWLK